MAQICFFSLNTHINQLNSQVTLEREVSLEQMHMKTSFKFICSLLYVQLICSSFPCLLCALGQTIAAHFKNLIGSGSQNSRGTIMSVWQIIF